MQPDTIEQARQAFLAGVARFEQGDAQGAEAAFAQALQLAPGRPSVLLNLGLTRVHLQRYTEALAPLREALAANPQAADGWAALGVACSALGHWAEALAALERALSLGLAHDDLRLRRARALARLGRVAEAVAAYRELLAITPVLADAWVELGELHRESGAHALAADCYRQGLTHGADPTLTGYLLAAVTREGQVPRPPRAYVQTLFDQYADDFDAHLVGTLGYQGHRVLVQRLPEAVPSRLLRVLDVGCGTGLCAPLVRQRAAHLTGVDLSAEMVAKARQRGLYDELIVGDLHEVLADTPQRFDLVLAADVFIYVGELESVFERLAACMTPGGWLAFTVERGTPGSGAELQPSLRYTHAPDYIAALAQRHGFRGEACFTEPIRHDQQRPLLADYHYLQHSGQKKPGSRGAGS